MNLLPNPRQPELSVVIPAFQEEGTLRVTLEEVLRYFEGRSVEVIIVDDGSTDGTSYIAKKYADSLPNWKLLRNDINMGKGYAVRAGVLQAKGKYIAFMDADLSMPLEEIDRILHWLGVGYDIAIGSRMIKGSVTNRRWDRKILGYLYNTFVHLWFIPQVRDVQCGLKCFKREVAHSCFKDLLFCDFSFDLEILIRALSMGYKIREVPIEWNDSRRKTRVRLLRDGFKMSVNLFRFATFRVNHSLLNVRFGISEGEPTDFPQG